MGFLSFYLLPGSMAKKSNGTPLIKLHQLMSHSKRAGYAPKFNTLGVCSTVLVMLAVQMTILMKRESAA